MAPMPIVIVGIFLALLRSGSSTQLAQGLTAESQHYVVVLAPPERAPRSLLEWRFLVRDETGRERDVPLEGLATDVIGKPQSLRIHGSRAFISGDTANGTAVVIADLRTARVVDDFLCLNCELSPTGRYLAFMEVKPRNSLDDGLVYRVYDLEGEARGRASTRFRELVDAGRRIVLRHGPSNQHVPLSKFYWLDDSSLAFADCDLTADRAGLVITVIGRDGRPSSQHWVPFPMDGDAIDRSSVEQGRKAANYMRVTSLRRTDLASIRVKFESNPVLRIRYFDAEFPR